MQSTAESACPARLLRGARNAGELYVKECSVEKSKKYGSVGEYPFSSVDTDTDSVTADENQDCLLHQAAIQELLKEALTRKKRK